MIKQVHKNSDFRKFLGVTPPNPCNREGVTASRTHPHVGPPAGAASLRSSGFGAWHRRLSRFWPSEILWSPNASLHVSQSVTNSGADSIGYGGHVSPLLQMDGHGGHPSKQETD